MAPDVGQAWAGFQPAGSSGILPEGSRMMRRANFNLRLESAAIGRQDACPIGDRDENHRLDYVRRNEAPASRDRRGVGCLAPGHARPRLQRGIVNRATTSGPKARHVKAWAGVRVANGGPGNSSQKSPRGLKGRNNFASPVPPFQGEEDLFRMFTWGFTPGYHTADFQPSRRRPAVVRARRVAGGVGRAEGLASRDRRRTRRQRCECQCRSGIGSARYYAGGDGAARHLYHPARHVPGHCP